MSAYRPANGDRVTVTRTTPDGGRHSWTGVISDLSDSLPGFRLDWPGGSSYFAGSEALAADPRWPIIQTVRPAQDEPREAPREHARRVCRPMDRQSAQPRRSTGKPGTAIQRAIAAYRNRRVLTVDGYLAAVGVSRDLIRKYRSAFGKAVAKAYRAATSAEPTQSGWAIAHGRMIQVFAYQDRALLDAVLAAYEVKSPKRARLTDLIGA